MNKSLPYAALLLSLGMIGTAEAAPHAKPPKAPTPKVSSEVREATNCIKAAVAAKSNGRFHSGNMVCVIDKGEAGLYRADANGVYVSGFDVQYSTGALNVRPLNHYRWGDAYNMAPTGSLDKPLTWVLPLVKTAFRPVHARP